MWVQVKSQNPGTSVVHRQRSEQTRLGMYGFRRLRPSMILARDQLLSILDTSPVDIMFLSNAKKLGRLHHAQVPNLLSGKFTGIRPICGQRSRYIKFDRSKVPLEMNITLESPCFMSREIIEVNWASPP